MQYWDYYGTPLPKLEEGQMAVGVVMTMKIIQKDGSIAFHEFKSPDIHAVEALGMLDTFSDTMREHIKQGSRRAE